MEAGQGVDMIYRKFQIQRFRGVKDVSVSLVKNDLVLLLGLNESGKTTILRGIETFDHRNDPTDPSSAKSFYRSIREKADLSTNEPAIVTAEIEFEESVTTKTLKQVLKRTNIPKDKRLLSQAFLDYAIAKRHVSVSRVFPFKDGNPGDPYYQFQTNHQLSDDQELMDQLASILVEMCPFIIYFEDFTDCIPEKIFVDSRNDAYNSEWHDIIDGLFFNTSTSYSIKAFKTFYSNRTPRPDDAKTMMKRINTEFNRVFTKKWEELSGVKDIAETELLANFSASKKHFEIKITDTDGTTYSVEERSKGALWYLSFLMKTEFRRKKMRKDSGKPIFLIDEPASNLHSTAQANMIQDFKKLVEDTSVIYTTHSQYLISLENIKHTYVIRRVKGIVSATLWADFIRENPSLVSHYQPLANLLQLIPNNFTVPWEKAVITEGPSDKNVLELMFRALRRASPTFVVYPGTGAHKLDTLISLNIGWNADFRVILDSDTPGLKAQKKYISNFQLDDQTVLVLPGKNAKTESYFTVNERKKLYAMAFGQERSNPVTKNEFKHTVAILNGRHDLDKEVEAAMSKKTQAKFEKLFNSLDLD